MIKYYHEVCIRTFLLFTLLIVGCAKNEESLSSCLPMTDTLFVSLETYPCINTVDASSSYKVIALAGGDTRISDPVLYKADLISKIRTAKTRATKKVIYFSSSHGVATAEQYAAAQEAVIEESVTTYDLFSISFAHPEKAAKFISDSIANHR